MCNSCKTTTDNVSYNSETLPVLPYLNLGNGTELNEILKNIDYIIGTNYPFNFGQYSIPYLKDKYTINNMANFTFAVSKELDLLNTKTTSLTTTSNSLSTEINSLKTRVVALEKPQITDTALAGFSVNDTLKVVLQKLTNKVGTLLAPTQVPISILSSNTVQLTASGSLNHTIGASVKISSQSGNRLQVNNDGLYVPPVTTSSTNNQTLSINGYSLGISNGNFVNLPIPQLSLQGTVLGLTNSNSVDIGNIVTTNQTPLTVQDSSTIDFQTSGINGHTLTGSVKISSNTNNKLTNSNGLYVAPVDNAALLTEVATTSTQKSSFCGIVNTCPIPLTFNIVNTVGSSQIINYVDVNNVPKSVSVANNNSMQITDVKRITTQPLSNLRIDFMGFSN